MQDFTELPFYEAFPLWFDAHKPYISPRTISDYDQYGKALMAFFGPLQLKNIGIGQLKGFQMWRSREQRGAFIGPLLQYQHSASSVRIKNEINGVLKPVLREAGIWADIEQRKFKHLPVPREGSGVPLTKEEQAEILAVGFSKKKLVLATHCLRIEYKTGTGFGELRRVKRRHVDLVNATVEIVEGAKNSGARMRKVPLVPSALDSMKWIIDRWENHGGTDPDSYILFHRSSVKSGEITKPMKSIHRSFVAIKREWAKRNPNAKTDTRQCDARTSTACLLLKNPAISLPTIHKVLGWMPSSRMRDRYNRVEIDQRRAALATLED